MVEVSENSGVASTRMGTYNEGSNNSRVHVTRICNKD